MGVALIAHDGRKEALIEFARTHRAWLVRNALFATETTASLLRQERFYVHSLKSGPLGGDQQIGAMVASGRINRVFFFRDPLSRQPHDADVDALMRLCDVYKVPLATNETTAQILVKGLSDG